MNTDLTVFFPIEVKNRCFESRLLTALHCLEYGISKCIIGSKSGVHKQMIEYNNRFIYVSKGIAASNTKLLERIKAKNGKVVYLDEEGGIDAKDWSTFLWRVKDNILQFVDIYFSWGVNQKELILRHRKNLAEENIVVTGNPRFDLLKFHEYADAEKPDIKGYILVNTSFGMANGYFTYEQTLHKVFNNFKEDFDRQRIEKHYHLQKILIVYFISAIRKLAAAFPDKLIVIRPHPAENAGNYIDSFSNFSNIRIIKQGSARPWIRNSACVIHYDCTTSIESFMCGIPFVSYSPFVDEEIIQYLPYVVSPKVRTEEELITFVRQVLEKNSPIGYERDRIMGEIKPYIHNVDEMACSSIAQTILERFKDYPFIPVTSAEKIQKPQNERAIKRRFLTKWNSLKARILPQTQNDYNAVNIKYTENKFPGISLKELEEKIHLIRKTIMPLLPDIEVVEVGDGAFALTRKL